MNRRMFVWNGAVAGALLPRVLGAQPSARVYRLGYIGLTGPPDPSRLSTEPQWVAFHDELAGRLRGRAQPRDRATVDRGPGGAHSLVVAELLGKNVDVLVTTHTGTARPSEPPAPCPS